MSNAKHVRLRRRRFVGITTALVAIAPLSAAGAATTAPFITIIVSSDSITLTQASTKAGVVAFELVTGGTDAHEIDIVRTDLDAGALPLKKNKQFNERAKGVVVVKEAVKVASGGRKLFSAKLTPGNYVLADNLPGHYGRGEHVALLVTK